MMDYCLACFGLKEGTNEDDTAPLIPTQEDRTDPLPAESKGDKFVDILVALNAGKLPSQEQLNNIFRCILKADLLHDDVNMKVVSGKGPMSKMGRKVIGDVRDVIQSMLQLGMEKNDDNKVQSIIYQLSRVEGVPVRVDIDAAPTADASRSAFNAAEASASKLREEAPSGGEIVSDSEILLSCIKILIRAVLTSSAFRVLIVDALDVARQLVVHAAIDVETAAEVVRDAAEDLEKKARDGDVNVGLEGMKEKGKEVANSFIDGSRKVRQEWEGTTEDLERDAKRKLVSQIQSMIIRAQRDHASRQALHAILLLVRKYSDVISKMTETLATTAADVSSAKTETYPPCPYPPATSVPTIDVDITSSALDHALKDMKVFIERLAKRKSINPLWNAFKQVILDMAEIPGEIAEYVEEKSEEKVNEIKLDSGKEQQAGGAKDEVLKARPPGGGTSEKGKKGKKKGKGKGQHAKTPTKEPEGPPEPSAWGDKVLGSEIVQPKKPSGDASQPRSEGSGTPSKAHSESQKRKSTPGPFSEKDFPPLPTKDETSSSKEKEKERRSTNPYRAYFSDVNSYLERALSEPGWAASDKGTRLLELLVDMGAELTSVTGETVGEAIGEMTAEDGGKPKGKGLTPKQRFRQDMQTLLNEIDKLTTAVESDRATMQFLKAFQSLGVDFAELLSEAPAQGKMKARAATMRSGLLGFGASWTQWISWALPKIMQMIPSDWMPIPTVEVKTPTVDGALDALWLKENASCSDGKAGIKGSLTPDQIILSDWTEVRLDMPTNDQQDHRERTIRTTSRIRVHMDGIRAAIRGMGYYFRYKGTFLDYEDDGILSVNLGTNKAKRGIGLNIELEVDSSTETLENVWHSDRGIPEIVVDGVAGANESNELSANIDVQHTVAPSCVLGNGVTRGIPISQTSLGPALQEPVEPLFRVVDVKLDLDEMNIHLDQSKHWILNKILMQPIGAPALAHIIRTAVEERIRDTLGWLAVGMGRLQSESRERRRKRRVAERQSIRQREPIWDIVEIENAIKDETMGDMVADWWGALIEKGPEAFGYDRAEEEDVERFTDLETTSRGVIYTSMSTTQQPGLGPILNPVWTPEEIETEDYISHQISPVVGRTEEETVVAVGTGPQLFPGKVGPYGQRNDEESSQNKRQGFTERAEEMVKTGVEGVTKGVDDTIQYGACGLRRAKERRDIRKKAELSRGGWQSRVFDLDWVS